MKRIAFIQGYSNSFSVGRMCHLLKVSRSHYYSVIHFEKSPDALTEKVVAIFSQHSKRYGSRRIIAELKEEHHISVGRQRIRRIMHEWLLTNIQEINNHKPYWLLVNLKIEDFCNDKTKLLEEFQKLMFKSHLIK